MTERASQEKIEASHRSAVERMQKLQEIQPEEVIKAEIVEQEDGTYTLDIWLR